MYMVLTLNIIVMAIISQNSLLAQLTQPVLLRFVLRPQHVLAGLNFMEASYYLIAQDSDMFTWLTSLALLLPPKNRQRRIRALQQKLESYLGEYPFSNLELVRRANGIPPCCRVGCLSALRLAFIPRALF